MKQEFLLNAMADIDETYVREAEKAPTARKRKLPWKMLVAAALIPEILQNMDFWSPP